MKPLKIGVAGAGQIGRKHFLNCLRLKDSVEVVAVADLVKSNTSKISKLGINTYQDYNEMLRKEDLDAGIIALPNFLHEDCSLAFAEAGCDFLIEKPLARSVEESTNILRGVEKNGVKTMVGMCHRFIPGVKKLKEAIDTGTLGRVDFASSLFFTGHFSTQGKGTPDWGFDPVRIGGGVLLDSGSHMIDMFQWFFGDMRKVSGHTETYYNIAGLDDYAEVSMRFRNGVNAQVILSWRSKNPCYRVEVAGEYGRMTALSKKFGIYDIGLLKGLISFGVGSIAKRVKGEPFMPVGDHIFYRELEYFVDQVRNDRDPEPGVRDWMRVADVIDQVYRQNNGHKEEKPLEPLLNA